MKTKILIIKLGYSETLDAEIGNIPSLGDVLRSTPILLALKEKYPNSDITWLVSREAEPLIKNNPYISRILSWDSFVPFQLMKEKFDVLISLEKIPGVCALADMIDAWNKYGFRFDSINGSYHGYENGIDFIDYIENKKQNGHKTDFWQKVLVEMLGVKWSEQEYVLGYQPKVKESCDIGLNWKVGKKWPVKGMTQTKWEDLAIKLEQSGFHVSWQEGLSNLFEYMDWIHSCRMLITSDSLGLHLGLAQSKKVIALYGPTDGDEIFYYRRGLSIHSTGTGCPKMPCYMPRCSNGIWCMEHIDIDEVVIAAQSLLVADFCELPN